MLLHRGHGSILSGFFRVLSCELLVSSLCSPFLEDFRDTEVSLSAEGVLGFSLIPDDVVGGFKSSVN